MSDPGYPRFSRGQRLQHLVLIVSFTALALTGLPQKFAGSALGAALIALMGGIEAVRIAHRASAVVLMGMAIYHLADVSYRVLVLTRPLSMRLGLDDARDFIQTVRYNLGRAAERPRMGRFTFEEKIEYWALVWGTGIMVATGFALWNPIATARSMPGQFIPAALAAHGGEALLAVLAVIVWHGYGVHVRHFNRSMFTGSLSEDEMREHHPRELEARLQGAEAAPSPEVVRRRRALFLPVAVVISLLLVFGLYEFVTFEQTAVATAPLTK